MPSWSHDSFTPSTTRSGAHHPRITRDAAGDDATYRERIKAIETRLLDEMEGQIDDLSRQRKAASAPALDHPLPLSQARRRLAHLIRLPEICARATCRRAGLCRGEPRQCLSMISPLLPKDVVAKLRVGPRSTRRGRAQAFAQNRDQRPRLTPR